MNKVVFFTDLQKLSDALNNFDMASFTDKRVPVKLHMGEIKNKFFTKPDFVKLVVDELKKVLDSKRQIMVCRELSKMYETAYRGTIDDVIDEMTEERGEFVIIIN